MAVVKKYPRRHIGRNQHIIDALAYLLHHGVPLRIARGGSDLDVEVPSPSTTTGSEIVTSGCAGSCSTYLIMMDLRYRLIAIHYHANAPTPPETRAQVTANPPCRSTPWCR